jgi:hypothetical protein
MYNDFIFPAFLFVFWMWITTMTVFYAKKKDKCLWRVPLNIICNENFQQKEQLYDLMQSMFKEFNKLIKRCWHFKRIRRSTCTFNTQCKSPKSVAKGHRHRTFIISNPCKWFAIMWNKSVLQCSRGMCSMLAED